MNQTPFRFELRAQARAMFLNYLAAQNPGKVALFQHTDFLHDSPFSESKFIGIADSKDAARADFGSFFIGNYCNVINL